MPTSQCTQRQSQKYHGSSYSVPKGHALGFTALYHHQINKVPRWEDREGGDGSSVWGIRLCFLWHTQVTSTPGHCVTFLSPLQWTHYSICPSPFVSQMEDTGVSFCHGWVSEHRAMGLKSTSTHSLMPNGFHHLLIHTFPHLISHRISDCMSLHNLKNRHQEGNKCVRILAGEISVRENGEELGKGHTAVHL